jgi:hypothetical protein
LRSIYYLINLPLSAILALVFMRYAYHPVYRWVTRGDWGAVYAAKAAVIGGVIAWVHPLEFTDSWNLEFPSDAYVANTLVKLFWLTLQTILWINIGVISFNFAIAAWVLAVYCAIGVFRTLQVIIVEISEHNKGPILGASALLIAFGESLRQIESWAPTLEGWLSRLF